LTIPIAALGKNSEFPPSITSFAGYEGFGFEDHSASGVGKDQSQNLALGFLREFVELLNFKFNSPLTPCQAEFSSDSRQAQWFPYFSAARARSEPAWGLDLFLAKGERP
jgi:hypothetical protein